MKISTAIVTRCTVAIALAASCLAGCGFFKTTEETMKSTEKTMKNIEKATEKIGSEGKGKEQPQPEAKHEPVLVDNKVIAMRVQAALKNEGAEFEHVTVDATREEIIMTGTVGTAKAKERAAEIARKVDPKVKLKNELKVGK